MTGKELLMGMTAVDEDLIAPVLSYQDMRKKRRQKWVACAACFGLLIGGMALTNKLLFTDSQTPRPSVDNVINEAVHRLSDFSFVMTAYAADGTEFPLGKEPILVSGASTLETGFYGRFEDGNGRGLEFFRFHIACNGEGIETITYSIDGEETAASVEEMELNNAWFASTAVSDTPVKAEFPVFSQIRTAGKAYAYSYCGSTYTVDYNSQRSDLCLVYRITNDGTQWSAVPISINVEILTSDGSTITKTLRLNPIFNESESIMQISVV